MELFDSDNSKTGELIGSFEFPVEERTTPGWAQLHIRSFSRSGLKLVVTYYERQDESGAHQKLKPKVKCLIPGEKCPTGLLKIDMPEHGGLALRDCQFTADEDRIVGRMEPPPDDVNLGGLSICVWELRRNPQEYHTRVQTVFLWKALDRGISFTVTPSITSEPEGGVLIALSDGGLIRRPVAQAWSSRENANLRRSRYGMEAAGKTVNHITLDGNTLLIISITGILFVLPLAPLTFGPDG